jgi:hemerythrin-like domain-containing protein
MKRHPALRDLSSDHHHALVQARRLLIAADDVSEPEGTNAGQAAREFLHFFQEHTRPHFREEEEVLLPAFSNYGDPAQEPIVQMLVEHVHINRLVTQLASEMDSGHPSPQTMRDLGTMLQGHVRLEENVVFPLIESQMPEQALLALAQRLAPGENSSLPQ